MDFGAPGRSSKTSITETPAWTKKRRSNGSLATLATATDVAAGSSTTICPAAKGEAMARIKGPGIDPNGSYEAVQLWGRGMYLLSEKTAPEPVLDGLMMIKISQEAARKIGRHKKNNETLAQAVERLALASLSERPVAG